MATSDSRETREERRMITAVFADLVGSTALGEHLDPEGLKVIVGDAIGRVIGAVESYGGTVKDLAGDGVLALFGAPTAHEDDPERAVRASLQIVEEIVLYAREVEAAWDVRGFGVRVGVQSGPVVVGAIGAGSRVEYAALGDAVNTASRLQAAAGAGEVLVGEETFRVVEPVFDWGRPTELTLKGRSAPIVAHVALAATGITRARGLEGVQARLIGRERELDAGRRAVAEVLAGTGGIVLLTGEPGIGKTRLVAELRDVFEAGTPQHGRALWIEGRCVSYGESMPYWPFRDLLRGWVGVLTDEPELRVRVALRRMLERLFGQRATELSPYLATLLGLTLEPEAARRLAELSPEALQYRTFEVVRQLISRLAEEGPVAVVLEDLHWSDPTSLQLLERLFADTEHAALLLVLTSRLERDHPWWGVKETASRELPHRITDVTLEALSGDAGKELLHALVGDRTLPPDVERRILEPAEGNPFFLEELIRSLVDAGAVTHDERGWRFVHDVPLEVPPTVEKVILARIDRLDPGARDALVAASVLGRQFGLPLLEAVTGDEEDAVRRSLLDLMRLDLIREGRRWPEPEYRFKHALIQEAAYRTLITADRNRLHREAARWLEVRYEGREEEVAGLLAHHWMAADDEDKAVTYLAIAGDRARQEYALDEAIGHYRELLPILERRGEDREIALVLFKLALALHMSLRFKEANETYQRAFGSWTPPEPFAGDPTATVRVATSYRPRDHDPRSAISWPDIQLCMQLFDRLVEQWPERTIVPSLADRWEIADDGLRYVFHLREGLVWSDGEPLTAGDIEFGIKRVLDPVTPGSSVAIYFVLENGQDFYLGRNADWDRVGVEALDDRTIEFRLVAPAPYFMSVMNRPDGGPQPRHAIEAAGTSWTDLGQVVSGAFQVVEETDEMLTLERQPNDIGSRVGNIKRVEFIRSSVADALGPYGRGDLDIATVRYTPKLADLVPTVRDDAELGPAAWSGYFGFDHAHAVLSNVDFRRALAHAIDREVLERAVPDNVVVATGGVVPPALQGHTPDIVLRFDPDKARGYLQASGIAERGVTIAGIETWVGSFLDAVAVTWHDVLGLEVRVESWTLERALTLRDLREVAPIVFTGWLPGYADPEYFLRLLFQSDSRTNEGGFSYPPFDELIERARRERSDRSRLELFHEADRMVVADRVALIPLVYGRSMAFVKPWVHGWWEFGKSSSAFASLVVDPSSPRA
jgi:ABC-type oligopeptide transport system substrate-binding subunit/class 3 adenylate cyclase